MPANSRTLPLAEKLLAYMSRKPNRCYVPNNFTILFRTSTQEVVEALETLREAGKLMTEARPPKGCVYYLSPQTPQHRYAPQHRELKGWEAGLRSRMALCELTRPK